MSTGGVSSLGNSAYHVNLSNNRAQRQQAFQTLANALNSNDLSGAQSAFAALQKTLPVRGSNQTNGP